MRILAIDPGTTQSAWVVYEDGEILDKGLEDNDDVLYRMRPILEIEFEADKLYIEMIASYGMPVGQEVFETCVWIGRFIQSWGEDWDFIYRKDVKMHLCGSNRAKDSNIRQAILDLYPRTGGGKTPQVGIKSQPGPLFGVSKDVWAALAVAITAAETNSKQEE